MKTSKPYKNNKYETLDYENQTYPKADPHRGKRGQSTPIRF